MHLELLRKLHFALRTLVPLLISIVAWSQVPTITVAGIDGLSHSTARIKYTWANGSISSASILYAVAPAACTDGGTQPSTTAPWGSPWAMVLAGLVPNTTYNVCIVLTNGFGTGVSLPVLMRTLPLPLVHPALPIPPDSFDSDYPDTHGYVNVTITPDCSNLQDAINQALAAQAAYGTVINIPAGSVCTDLRNITFSIDAADTKHFGADAVSIGSPGTITLPAHGLVEGQLITFGKEYAGWFPTSSSCQFDNGIVDGSKYYVHVVDANTISVYCGDKATLMAFSDQGGGPLGFLLAPHVKADGHCPTTSGERPCTYWRRNLYWIVIRSSAPDVELPPEHTRLTPAWCKARKCVTLVNPVANVGINASTYTFITHGGLDGNHHPMTANIRWGPGVEVTNAIDPNYGTYANLVYSSPWNSDIVFDCVYLHGGGTPQRWGGLGLPAFQFNGLDFAFKDSYIDNLTNWDTGIHEGASGILSRGPGPTALVNNYFEGVGIPIHFDDGGGAVYIRGDNTVIRNYFKSPTRYMHGSSASDGYKYGMRQPLEFKAGFRNQISGNIFDTAWVEVTPASVFVAFTSVAGEGISDTDVTNNTFMHGPGVTNIPLVVAGGAPQTPPPNRFRFYNNFATDIGSSWWVPAGGAASPTGWLFEGPQGGEDVIVDHNTTTGVSGRLPSIFTLFDTNFEGMQVTNNIFQVRPGYGIVLDGSILHPCSGFSDAALWACAMSTNSTWSDNLLIPNGGDLSQLQSAFRGLPSFYAPSYSSVTTLVATGAITGRSAYLQSQICEFCGSQTTNGKAVGVNLNELQVAQGYVAMIGVVPSGTSATISFVAPDSQGCPVDYSFSDPNVISDATRVADLGRERVRLITLVGLRHQTKYYFRVNCATQQPMATFQIN
jgi:hypothetical protein